MSNQQINASTDVEKQITVPQKSEFGKWFLLGVIVLLFICIVGLISGMAKTNRETALQLKLLQENNEKNTKEMELLRITSEEFQKKLQDSQINLKIMEQAAAEMGRGFKILSVRDVKLQGLTFAQPITTDADRELAANIGKQLKAKTPAELVRAAEKVLQKRAVASRDLQIDASTGNVYDSVAGIVEQAAKDAGLKAATKIAWDLDHKKYHVLTAILDPKGKLPKAAYSTAAKLQEESTYQTTPKTTVFPFTAITLMSNTERIIANRSSCIPLGGAYVHYFRIFAKDSWSLEYDFPAGIDPESVNMNLLMLSPGVSASSAPANGRMKFFFGASASETAFLVFADKPFFPLRIAISLDKK